MNSSTSSFSKVLLKFLTGFTEILLLKFLTATAIPVNEEILDKIDQVKLKFGIEFPGYRDVINRMCDILLEMNKLNRIKVGELKTTIEKTFKFLQEKVREDDYFYEEFFNELVKIYNKIIVCLRK